MKLLVAATLRSVPACNGMTHSAALASGEEVSFTKATVVAPPAQKRSTGMHRSGLRPDWDIDTTSRSRAEIGAR